MEEGKVVGKVLYFIEFVVCIKEVEDDRYS